MPDRRPVVTKLLAYYVFLSKLPLVSFPTTIMLAMTKINGRFHFYFCQGSRYIVGCEKIGVVGRTSFSVH